MEPPSYELDRKGGEAHLVIRAPDLDGVCTSLAFSLCDLFVEASGVRTSGDAAVILPLDLQARSSEELVLLLARLLLQHLSNGRLLPVLWALELDDEHLHGELLGEQFDSARHRRRPAPPRAVAGATLARAPVQPVVDRKGPLHAQLLEGRVLLAR
jgi:hypothetical protein